MKLSLLLFDIRSLHNVGALMRTADGAGFDTVYLCGITGTPPRKEISKTALGAEEYVAWEYYERAETLFAKLESEGVKIVALEQSDRSVDYRTFVPDPEGSYCLLLGNEVAGVPEDVVRRCDVAVEIPMRGQKKSLNVATAAGILMYHLSSAKFPSEVCAPARDMLS